MDHKLRFGGSKRPIPSGTPINRDGGRSPPPQLMGFLEGRGRLDHPNLGLCYILWSMTATRGECISKHCITVLVLLVPDVGTKTLALPEVWKGAADSFSLRRSIEDSVCIAVMPRPARELQRYLQVIPDFT